LLRRCVRIPRGKGRPSACEAIPPGTGFLDAETGPPKSPPETTNVAQRPKWAGTDSGNPGTYGLSEPDWKLPGSEGLDGGRDRDRTCDPLDVNEVLET
jgi:hypothetical protein